MTQITTHRNQVGFFSRLCTRLFGEPDPVDEQLKDIARQGSGMAKAAHVCALALIALFSLGSLVALSGDALTSILAQWQSGAGINIPAAISVAVSTLLVLCMDVGMIYAASMLRVLSARRAEPAEKRLHHLVMLTVAALEAGTYGYMSAHYEHPETLVVWALIIARACAAPLLSVYLSMARPLPVGPRDILYQVELASGKGVIRDVVTVANDTGAPLSQKITLYGASAIILPQDRSRLDSMIAVIQQQSPVQVVEATPDQLISPDESLTQGSRLLRHDSLTGKKSPSQRSKVIQLASHTQSTSQRSVKAKPTAEQRVRKALTRYPDVGLDELARLADVAKGTAKKYRALAEQEQRVHASITHVDPQIL